MFLILAVVRVFFSWYAVVREGGRGGASRPSRWSTLEIHGIEDSCTAVKEVYAEKEHAPRLVPCPSLPSIQKTRNAAIHSYVHQSHRSFIFSVIWAGFFRPARCPLLTLCWAQLVHKGGEPNGRMYILIILRGKTVFGTACRHIQGDKPVRRACLRSVGMMGHVKGNNTNGRTKGIDQGTEVDKTFEGMHRKGVLS